jgi:hydroxymethylglutaryl-CoA reductase (NADPH)
LVIIIGFEKPFILFRSILTANIEDTDVNRKSSSKSTTPLSVRRKILIGIDKVGPTILNHYLAEVLILALGAISGIPQVAEFCCIAFLVVAFDCFYMFTIVLAFLTIKMELKCIRESEDVNFLLIKGG